MVKQCCLCKRAEDSCNHVLLWCPIAHSLWTMAYGILGFNWIMAGILRSELWAWKGLTEQKKYLGLIPLRIFWVVLKERNKGVFEGVEEGINKIREKWFQMLDFLVIRCCTP